MTYQGQPTTSTNTVLKVFIVATIIWIAYWSSTGGLDRIVVPERVATDTTSPIAE